MCTPLCPWSHWKYSKGCFLQSKRHFSKLTSYICFFFSSHWLLYSPMYLWKLQMLQQPKHLWYVNVVCWSVCTSFLPLSISIVLFFHSPHPSIYPHCHPPSFLPLFCFFLLSSDICAFLLPMATLCQFFNCKAHNVALSSQKPFKRCESGVSSLLWTIIYIYLLFIALHSSIPLHSLPPSLSPSALSSFYSFLLSFLSTFLPSFYHPCSDSLQQHCKNPKCCPVQTCVKAVLYSFVSRPYSSTATYSYINQWFATFSEQTPPTAPFTLSGSYHHPLSTKYLTIK